MSEKLKTYTFLQLLEQGYICIPRIQRGYAQGRQTKKIDEIRRNFLHTLFQVIKGERQFTELDFVYGSTKGEAFEPLDGQQRLTTLFLIHWMLGVDLTRKGNEKHSVFTYASCPTSEDFSNALVSHDAIALITETLDKREKSDKADITPARLIEKRDWFYWEWKFDPSISSMLVMIDSIFAEITSDEKWEDHLADFRSNINNITFNGLNLGDFGLSNELFIKMNARGKQLSDFDKVKSTLEEEIQIQETESDINGTPLASISDESDWRTLMDGKWSDYFWHNYARKKIVDSKSLLKEDRKPICLAAAKDCERHFKKLLLRVIQLQLLSKRPISEELREACYKRNENEIDNLLIVYNDTLLPLRRSEPRIVGTSETLIDFASLIKTINALLVEDEDGTIRDIFQLLPKNTYVNCDDINLMHSFLEDNVANDVALIFFAALQFLDSFPFQNNNGWKTNFSRWIKSQRNMLSNNNNTQRIDKLWRYENAMNAIIDMSHDLVAYGKEHNIKTTDNNFVSGFFKSLSKTYNGIENSALKEEKDKSALLLSDSLWENAITAAEDDSYLWGQIRALIEWADGDIDKFKKYSAKLAELLGFIHTNSNTYYLAALKLHPNAWNTSNRLYQLNYDRDNSFKRYLRDYDKSVETNAPLMKSIIDLWISHDYNLNAEDFMTSILSDETLDTPVWLECIIKEPTILDHSYNKRLFEDRGHVVLAQLKTMDSHCIDPILKYLQILADNEGKKDQVNFDDSKGTPPHSISYSTGTEIHTLTWGEKNGMYRLYDQQGNSQELDASDAVEQFLEHLLNH
ncbi:MAG: DUF262 domain-containing protein [Bacteroides sp.]|nr:DUF262 domain-containing protein [Bacteroides sp.]